MVKVQLLFELSILGVTCEKSNSNAKSLTIKYLLCFQLLTFPHFDSRVYPSTLFLWG